MNVDRRTPASTENDHFGDSIEIDGEVFARRLASLMIFRRKEMGLSVRAVARRSGGRFTRSDLQLFEAMNLRLDAVLASALADLYRIDLDSLLPERDVAETVASTGSGVDQVDPVHPEDDASCVLLSYLRLIRRLRGQISDEVVALRRADIEHLSALLGEPGEAIVVRLGALMGATRFERREMAGNFLSGAAVVTVTGR